MSAYDSQYENADVILFEPDRDDEKMFFANVFSFSHRRWVCEHAYQTIRNDLLARYEDLEPILARHGITMRMDILEDKNRHFSTGLYEKSAPIDKNLIPPNELTQNLEQTLNQLQRFVHSMHN
jgi:NTE family protein